MEYDDLEMLRRHSARFENRSRLRPRPNLPADEQEAYSALRRDVYGPAVRLEQERIRFGVVERR